MLRNVSGGPNIVALLDVVRDPSHAYHSLIMEYVDNTDWKVLLRSMSELDMKYYLFQLLKVRFFGFLSTAVRSISLRPWILSIPGVLFTATSSRGML